MFSVPFSLLSYLIFICETYLCRGLLSGKMQRFVLEMQRPAMWWLKCVDASASFGNRRFIVLLTPSIASTKGTANMTTTFPLDPIDGVSSVRLKVDCTA